MKRILFTLAAFALLTGGAIANSGGKKVVHRVSVGGNDICESQGEPVGCDANFSLVAMEKADGSVTGQWQDTLAGGGEGIHVAVDCLNVVGNGAVIGGVITHGTSGGVDLTGEPALTAVVDMGKSAKDLPDQISYSYFLDFSLFPGGDNCADSVPTQFPLFELPRGQVIVHSAPKAAAASLDRGARAKVDICHVDDEGNIFLINVSERAVPKHIAKHGDVLLADSLFYEDADNDGAGDAGSSTTACNQPPGFVDNMDDLCPADPTLTTQLPTFYGDADGDGFGDPATTTEACTAPPGFVDNMDDLCPADPALSTQLPTFYGDADGDGFGDPAVTTEACAAPPGFVDNMDDLCPADSALSTQLPTFYADNDGDGFGDPAVTTEACAAPAGFVANDGDCNDSEALAWTGAPEIVGDGVDNDCDPATPDGPAVCPCISIYQQGITEWQAFVGRPAAFDFLTDNDKNGQCLDEGGDGLGGNERLILTSLSFGPDGRVCTVQISDPAPVDVRFLPATDAEQAACEQHLATLCQGGAP
jgi:hypothetical protein